MLKLYPRGFVGPEPAIKSNDENDELKNEIQMVGNTFRVKSSAKPERPFDKDVSILFDQYRNDTTIMNIFEYREKLLTKAKDMLTFNGEINSFKQFLISQVELGQLSLNHVECLKEISDFILNSKVGYRIVIWERILSDADNILLTPRDKAEVVKTFNKIDDDTYNSINTTIAKWTSQREGYAHLLRTLWLFYGESLNKQGE